MPFLPRRWRTLKQRAGTAGEIQHLPECFLFAGGRVLAVQRDDTGEDGGKLLRGLKLPGLLAGTCGELAAQGLVGITQQVPLRRELRQPLRNLLDEGAELVVALPVVFAQLFGVEADLREQPLEVAGEGFVCLLYTSPSPRDRW